jgi:hypothetical protein
MVGGEGERKRKRSTWEQSRAEGDPRGAVEREED